MSNSTVVLRVFTTPPTTADLPLNVGDMQIIDGTVQVYKGSGIWQVSQDGQVGNVYYVNNITGSDANDGLSWNTAVAQVSQAITLAEAFRAKFATNNQYIRNTILIQGTATRYNALSALPNYCDIIGIGASPFGDGAGIVRIGSISTAHGIAGSTRGTNWHNIQFNAGGSFDAVNLTVAYRTTFTNCGFGSASDNAACDNAFKVVAGSGLVLRDCKTLAHAAFPVVGYSFAVAGGNFNECLIERCYANASGSGMLNAGYLNNGTVIRDCICYGGTSGIMDTSAQTGDEALAFYFHNFASGATNGIVMTNSPERHCMDNYSVGNATSLLYYALG